MTPEQKARLNIDKMLEESGYVIQNKDEFNPMASLGVVVREFATESGPVDYLMFIDGIPVGVIEAKEVAKGETLTEVAEQSKRYAESGIKNMQQKPDIRFAYESTGERTRFCDYHDEKARSRDVFAFHRPETLHNLIKAENTIRNNMKTFPDFDNTGFRKCQTNAIINLEESLSDNKPRALIQMATGAGKTFTAITAVYRLLKYAKVGRVLFLVDTKNLGEQAEGEFLNYRPSDSGRLFGELYNVRRLNSSYIPQDTHVVISTIQRMYSILRGEELGEDVEEENPNETNIVGQPREVCYNPKYPPEFFDVIIIDECHRSIYNIWQQVLDYFDSFLIGLTATPDSRTFGFFNQNIVSEYTHEQAVLDNVNVGREGTYIIETEKGTKGGQILSQTVEKRDRLSRKRRWEQSDEDIDYSPTQLDRDIVNPSQIRMVIREFKNKWQSMFSGREELPKTLVFAKTDSHADDIINIIREEFGEGNEFCKKITYQSAEDPKSVLTSFRNDYYPRIAVTVDMIATGTDVKPIECLIFMRDVRSKNYFEQMLGRATRTLSHENLKAVSPSAKTNKLGFVVVDAVGVTKSQKTTSRQIDRFPTASLKQLMQSVLLGARDEDTLTSLAAKLIRLDKQMTDRELDKFAKLCTEENIILEKVSPNGLAGGLLNAFDADYIADSGKPKDELIKTAVIPFFNPNLRNYLENIRRNHDQIIDPNIDQVTFSDWAENAEINADEIIDTFKKFINENKDEIDALQIIYNQSYKERPLTLEMIDDMYEIMKQEPYRLTTEKVWHAYSIKNPSAVKVARPEKQLAEIISLLRFELGHTSELNLFSLEVNTKFQKWIWDKNSGHGQFTEEQTEWLRLIKEHIATSCHIEKNDLDLTPFDSKGGLGKFYQLFGNQYEEILNEMNYALVA